MTTFKIQPGQDIFSLFQALGRQRPSLTLRSAALQEAERIGAEIATLPPSMTYSSELGMSVTALHTRLHQLEASYGADIRDAQVHGAERVYLDS